MLSFFDPRSVGTKSTTQFNAVVIGDFVAGADAAYKALVALAPTLSAATGPSVPAVRAWVVTGTAAGPEGATTNGTEIDAVADCAIHAGSGVCVDDAAYLSWTVATDHDVVLAVDRAASPHAGVVDPLAVTDDKVTATAVPALTANVPAGASIRSLYAADVDGDGAPDLIATFARAPPVAGARCSQARSSRRWASRAAAGDVTLAIVAVASTITDCVDAAPGKFQLRDPTIVPTAATEVIAAMSRWRRQHETCSGVIENGGGAFSASVLAAGLGPVIAIRIGDVNGDGVDDVVALYGQHGLEKPSSSIPRKVHGCAGDPRDVHRKRARDRAQARGDDRGRRLGRRWSRRARRRQSQRRRRYFAGVVEGVRGAGFCGRVGGFRRGVQGVAAAGDRVLGGAGVSPPVSRRPAAGVPQARDRAVSQIPRRGEDRRPRRRCRRQSRRARARARSASASWRRCGRAVDRGAHAARRSASRCRSRRAARAPMVAMREIGDAPSDGGATTGTPAAATAITATIDGAPLAPFMLARRCRAARARDRRERRRLRRRCESKPWRSPGSRRSSLHGIELKPRPATGQQGSRRTPTRTSRVDGQPAPSLTAPRSPPAST